MSAPRIILAPLLSICQKLSKLVEIWLRFMLNAWLCARYKFYYYYYIIKDNFAQVFETRCKSADVAPCCKNTNMQCFNLHQFYCKELIHKVTTIKAKLLCATQLSSVCGNSMFFNHIFRQRQSHNCWTSCGCAELSDKRNRVRGDKNLKF